VVKRRNIVTKLVVVDLIRDILHIYLRPCGKRIPENWQDLGRTKAWIFVFGGGKILRSPVSAIRCER
jgi:hypothetical protein